MYLFTDIVFSLTPYPSLPFMYETTTPLSTLRQDQILRPVHRNLILGPRVILTLYIPPPVPRVSACTRLNGKFRFIVDCKLHCLEKYSGSLCFPGKSDIFDDLLRPVGSLTLLGAPVLSGTRLYLRSNHPSYDSDLWSYLCPILLQWKGVSSDGKGYCVGVWSVGRTYGSRSRVLLSGSVS